MARETISVRELGRKRMAINVVKNEQCEIRLVVKQD